jgi:hypothetical protein
MPGPGRNYLRLSWILPDSLCGGEKVRGKWSRRLYREKPNPPKSPFAKGGLENFPLKNGGRRDFHPLRVIDMVMNV